MNRIAWLIFAGCLFLPLGLGQEPPVPAPAPKPKPVSKEYVLTVVLVKAADGSAVEEASVRVSYGGLVQTKPATSGTVTFRFTTDASEAVVRVNAPGMVIYNKAVPLKEEKMEYMIELDPSD